MEQYFNDFAAGDNDYEIPIFDLIILLTVFVYGSGKWRLDVVISMR
jgi:hypothetical protein